MVEYIVTISGQVWIRLAQDRRSWYDKKPMFSSGETKAVGDDDDSKECVRLAYIVDITGVSF